jgi:hypothetical protein
MKKFLFMVILTFSLPVLSFSFDYWYLDVTDEDPFPGTSLVKRVYFFRDLSTLESATGFPRKENEDRINRYRWKWAEAKYKPNTYYTTIYSVMRKEGFMAAFVLNSSGISITRELYYTYSIFLLFNGKEYHDTAAVYNNPVKF